MTNREFYTEVIASENISLDIKEHAARELAKMDARNEKRSSTQTAKQKENAELGKRIIEWMAPDTVYIGATLAAEFEVSVQKIAPLMKPYEADGTIVTEMTKNGKKGKVKGYKLA